MTKPNEKEPDIEKLNDVETTSSDEIINTQIFKNNLKVGKDKICILV